MRLCICALFLSFLALGCVSDPADDAGTSEQGLAEIRIDAKAMLAANISHVTLEGGGQSATLMLSSATSTYDGALLLPAGPQLLVARAFSGPTLVGLSNPTPVNVGPGAVTRVLMRILDLTGSAPPLYGPIFDSLVYPATAPAATPVTFTASVVAPVGDPIAYAWSSSCSDSTFSAPTGATTSWAKPTQGPCTITLSATSNGITIVHGFQIVVFPAGSATGAVDVSASFISAPDLALAFPSRGCYLGTGSNASCPGAIASPTVSAYEVGVLSWGGSTAGSLTLSDNCGGAFGTSDSNPDYRMGHWLPPITPGVCILTATAVNSDGLVSTLSAAFLVRPGAPPTTQPPTVYGGGFCPFASTSPQPTDCGSLPAGTITALYGAVNWANGHPGSIQLLDDCNGGLIQPTNTSNFNTSWQLPSTPGATCTVTIRARNVQGVLSEATAQVTLF